MKFELTEEVKSIQDRSLKFVFSEGEKMVSPDLIKLYEPNNEYEKWKYYTGYWVSVLLSQPELMKQALNEGESGNKYKIAALADIFLSSEYEYKDDQKAQEYTMRAIEAGSGYSAFRYALFLMDDPTGNSMSTIEHYLRKAVELRCEEAGEYLSIIAETKRNTQEKTSNQILLTRSQYNYSGEISGGEYMIMDLGSEYADPVLVDDLAHVPLWNIEKCLEQACKIHGVQAIVTAAHFTYGGMKSTLRATIELSNSFLGGGLFEKSQFRALLVSHPNPPQNYCNELIILLNDGVRFFFVGSSDAFRDKNNYENFMSGDMSRVDFISKMKLFVGITPNEEEFNKEMMWHKSVYDAFLMLE